MDIDLSSGGADHEMAHEDQSQLNLSSDPIFEPLPTLEQQPVPDVEDLPPQTRFEREQQRPIELPNVFRFAPAQARVQKHDSTRSTPKANLYGPVVVQDSSHLLAQTGGNMVEAVGLRDVPKVTATVSSNKSESEHDQGTPSRLPQDPYFIHNAEDPQRSNTIVHDLSTSCERGSSDSEERPDEAQLQQGMVSSISGDSQMEDDHIPANNSNSASLLHEPDEAVHRANHLAYATQPIEHPYSTENGGNHQQASVKSAPRAGSAKAQVSMVSHRAPIKKPTMNSASSTAQHIQQQHASAPDHPADARLDVRNALVSAADAWQRVQLQEKQKMASITLQLRSMKQSLLMSEQRNHQQAQDHAHKVVILKRELQAFQANFVTLGDHMRSIREELNTREATITSVSEELLVLKESYTEGVVILLRKVYSSQDLVRSMLQIMHEMKHQLETYQLNAEYTASQLDKETSLRRKAYDDLQFAQMKQAPPIIDLTALADLFQSSNSTHHDRLKGIVNNLSTKQDLVALQSQLNGALQHIIDYGDKELATVKQTTNKILDTTLLIQSEPRQHLPVDDHELESLRNAIAELQTKLSEAVQSLSSAEEQLGILSLEKSKAQDEEHRAVAQAADIMLHCKHVENELTTRTAELAQAKAETTTYATSLAKACAEVKADSENVKLGTTLEIQNLQSQVGMLQKDNADRKDQLVSMAKHKDALSLQLEDALVQVRSAASLRGELALLQKDAKDSFARRAELESMLDDAQSARAALENKLAVKADKINALEASKLRSDNETVRMVEESTALKAQIVLLDTKYAALVEQEHKLKEDVHRVWQKEKQGYDQTITSLQGKITEQTELLTEHEEKRQHLVSQLEHAQTSAATTAEQQVLLQAEVEYLTVRYAAAQEEVSLSKSHSTAAEQSVQTLQHTIVVHEASLAAKDQEIRALEDRTQEMSVQLRQMRMERAAETLMQDSIVPGLTCAQTADKSIQDSAVGQPADLCSLTTDAAGQLAKTLAVFPHEHASDPSQLSLFTTLFENPDVEFQHTHVEPDKQLVETLTPTQQKQVNVANTSSKLSSKPLSKRGSDAATTMSNRQMPPATPTDKGISGTVLTCDPKRVWKGTDELATSSDGIPVLAAASVPDIMKNAQANKHGSLTSRQSASLDALHGLLSSPMKISGRVTKSKKRKYEARFDLELTQKRR